MTRHKKRGKRKMETNCETSHVCEVCGQEKCHHCQECGTPTTTHATTCSQYVSKHTIFHKSSGLTFTLTVRNGELLTLQRMTNDWPLTWENIPSGTESWEYWQKSISQGLFDYTIN